MIVTIQFKLYIDKWIRVILAVTSTAYTAVKLKPEKRFPSVQGLTHVPCDTGAVLYQLS